MLIRLAPWLVTIIAVVFAGLTWRLADLRAEALILERNQALEAAAVTQAALAWQKAQTEAISQALSRRDESLEEIAQSMADKRQSLDTLERSDAETRNWAEQPLPDGVVSWVRKLGTEADSGAADVHGTATPDQADSGPKLSGISNAGLLDLLDLLDLLAAYEQQRRRFNADRASVVEILTHDVGGEE